MPEPPAADDHAGEVSPEELNATKQQLSSYQELIEEIPQLYERKFRERLQPILERNEQLIEEGRRLEEQVANILPPESVVPVRGILPPSRPPNPATPLPPRRRRWWLAFGSLAALLVAGGGFLHTTRQPPRAQPQRIPSPAAKTRPGTPASTTQRVTPAPGELLLKTKGISWMEVRTLTGATLFIGTLQGSHTFPLGQGLRISAGRPDLVTVEAHGESARILGGIREIGWHTFPPMSPDKARAASTPEPRPTP